MPRNALMLMPAPSPSAATKRNVRAIGGRRLVGGQTALVQPAEVREAVQHRDDAREPLAQHAADAAHVKRIAGGDRFAMRLLFLRYQKEVYRFILRMVHDVSTAEDLTADVFLDVWHTAGRFKGHSAVKTWLLGIARFKALSSLRQAPSEPLDEQAAAEIVDLACSPEAVVDHQDRSAIIRRCLARLSAKHREVIDLVYYHDQSVAEVAALVGISESTVKTRMFYARRRLAALLRAAGIDRTACAVAFGP